MKIIYSSKLYKASKRKDRIHAAINNPKNSELLIQLSSYLDKPYRHLAKRSDPEDDTTSVAFDVPSDDTPDNDNLGPRPSGGSPSHSGGGSFTFKPESSPSDNFDESLPSEGPDMDESSVNVPDDSEDTSIDTPDVDIEQSVDINNSTDPDITNIDKVTQGISTIRDELEKLDSTSEIGQIRVKGNELWIYYKDSINLNNIMDTVIDKISKLDDKEFNCLSFNRLARSENAIVFEIQQD